MTLLGDIRAVSGTEELARQIEDFDFEAAIQTLDELKKAIAKKVSDSRFESAISNHIERHGFSPLYDKQ
jgi:hypothetical protein